MVPVFLFRTVSVRAGSGRRQKSRSRDILGNTYSGYKSAAWPVRHPRVGMGASRPGEGPGSWGPMWRFGSGAEGACHREAGRGATAVASRAGPPSSPPVPAGLPATGKVSVWPPCAGVLGELRKPGR